MDFKNNNFFTILIDNTAIILYALMILLVFFRTRYKERHC
jgi:hypothetical protein